MSLGDPNNTTTWNEELVGVLTAATVGMAVITSDTTVCWANPALLEMTGRNSTRGWRLADLVPEDRRRELETAAAGAGPVDVTAPLNAPECPMLPVRISVLPSRAGDDYRLTVVLKCNVSATEPLPPMSPRDQASLTALVENTEDAIYFADEHGRAVAWNRSYADAIRALLGIEMRPGVRPHDFLNDAQLRQLWDGLHERVLSGERFVEVYSHETADGEVLHFEHFFNPVFAGDQVCGFSEVTRNITERKRGEEALARATRMEAMAVLAGGVAHDLNNLMAGVTTNAEALRLELPSSPFVTSVVNDIGESARRASSLAENLMAYARGRQARRQPVDVAAIAQRVVQRQRQGCPAGVRVACIAEDLQVPALVEANPAQLEQVFVNLCRNAVEAVDGDGNVEVRLAETTVADELRTGHGEPLPPGRFVQVTVCDDGPGIDRALSERVFEPFVTSKGQGRGLGLAAVYGIIQDLGGRVDLHSRPHGGTTFTVHLPVLEGTEAVKEGS